MAADIEFLTTLMDNSEIEVNMFLPDLSPEQTSQIEAYVVAFMRIREFAWFQYRIGILDDATWVSYIAPTVALLTPANTRQVWVEQSRFLDVDFVAYVNKLLDGVSVE